MDQFDAIAAATANFYANVTDAKAAILPTFNFASNTVGAQCTYEMRYSLLSFSPLVRLVFSTTGLLPRMACSTNFWLSRL